MQHRSGNFQPELKQSKHLMSLVIAVSRIVNMGSVFGDNDAGHGDRIAAIGCYVHDLDFRQGSILPRLILDKSIIWSTRLS